MVSRRQILQGVLSPHRQQLFPPWSVDHEQFLSLCTRCDDCIKSCPQKILKRNEQGYPVLDFSHAGCTFCGDCVNACASGSLSLMEFIGIEPWRVKAVVSEFCVNYRGTVCQMCSTSCSDNALKFSVHSGGLTLPEINQDECTGCGECYRSCPKQAIDLKII